MASVINFNTIFSFSCRNIPTGPRFDVYRPMHHHIVLQQDQLDAPMYQIYFILE